MRTSGELCDKTAFTYQTAIASELTCDSISNKHHPSPSPTRPRCPHAFSHSALRLRPTQSGCTFVRQTSSSSAPPFATSRYRHWRPVPTRGVANCFQPSRAAPTCSQLHSVTKNIPTASRRNDLINAQRNQKSKASKDMRQEEVSQTSKETSFSWQYTKPRERAVEGPARPRNRRQQALETGGGCR